MKELTKEKLILIIKTAAIVAVNAAIRVLCNKTNGGDVVWNKKDPRSSKNSSKKHS